MSAKKRTKSSKKPTKKDKHALSPIEKKLLDCCKNRQPVLLHGDDPIGRLNLILGIHIDNGGITDAVQYIGVKDEPDSKVFLERIENEIEEAEKDWFAEHREFFRNHHGSIDSPQDFYRYGGQEIDPTELNNFKEDVYCKARRAFESTNKTWLHHDGNSYGDSIHENLEYSGFWYQIKFLNSNIHHPMIGGRYLYDFKGTLFLDNLKCDSSSNREVEHYCKFGMEIRDKKLSVNWLVAYVHNRDNFPDHFINQFEPVSLDVEDTVVASVIGYVGKQPSGHDNNITSNPLFMDDQKNVLYFDKEKTVTLKPVEIKLIEYLRKQDAFELKQILTEHFTIKLTETYKHSETLAESLSLNTTKPTIEEKNKAISKGERNKFDTYKSIINKKCQPLGIGDLIVKHGDIKKAFKLSVEITKKTLQL